MQAKWNRYIFQLVMETMWSVKIFAFDFILPQIPSRGSDKVPPYLTDPPLPHYDYPWREGVGAVLELGPPTFLGRVVNDCLGLPLFISWFDWLKWETTAMMSFPSPWFWFVCHPNLGCVGVGDDQSSSWLSFCQCWSGESQDWDWANKDLEL